MSLMDGNSPPDPELMRRVAGRDGDALAVLYDRYAPRVYGLCLRILSESQLAEDILQEVFVRVWERAILFEQSRGSVSAWVMGIARNSCIDQLRRMQARPVAADPPSLPDALPFEESLASEGSDVPALAARNERARLVRRALAELSAEQQRVIDLSYFKGYTRREIARQLNWPEGTVHTRARLALQKLRQRLDELGLGADDLP
jgi:RNA polymerase sigma-70 factor (ECF subfamily)